MSFASSGIGSVFIGWCAKPPFALRHGQTDRESTDQSSHPKTKGRLREAQQAFAFVGAVLLAVGLESVSAQPISDPPSPPQFKYSTPTPPGIASPDKVETRLGTLNFFDGFPDKAALEKLYDNLDFQRAVQSYLLALPAVSLTGMRAGLASFGPANSTLVITEQMMDSRSLFLTANDNTVYSTMWIDLRDGPVVAEIPPKVLGYPKRRS